VNNDFHKTHDIFGLFKGLSVKNFGVEVATVDGIESNGHANVNTSLP
jgi:hypothetical protein